MTSDGLDVSETSLSELYIYINAFHCMYTVKYWTGLMTFLKTWSAKTWLVHFRLGRIIKDFIKASTYF